MPTRNNPRLHWAWWLLGIAMLLAWQYWPHEPASSQPAAHASTPASDRAPTAVDSRTRSPTQPLPDERLPGFLPAEARTTIALIRRGGPFPYRQDGGVFGNREGHLPRKPRGWYREYTVDTPGLSHRGARRIVTGGDPPQTWHYSSDHYESFRGFDPGTASGVSP